MDHGRRSVLAALGLAAPFGLWGRASGSSAAVGEPPVLRLCPFEQGVREAFATAGPHARDGALPCRRVEVGHSDLLRLGVQGCHNDRPFAGFPAGHLRIVRTGSEPGPVMGGVRLYVSTVDVAFTGGLAGDAPSRPLDFAALPAAATLAASDPGPVA